VIVNLQWTPKDRAASLIIRARCDALMHALTTRLGVAVPPYDSALDPIATALPYTGVTQEKSSLVLAAPAAGRVGPRSALATRGGRHGGPSRADAARSVSDPEHVGGNPDGSDEVIGSEGGDEQNDQEEIQSDEAHVSNQAQSLSAQRAQSAQTSVPTVSKAMAASTGTQGKGSGWLGRGLKRKKKGK
jgi:hypothetical protein